MVVWEPWLPISSWLFGCRTNYNNTHGQSPPGQSLP